MDSEIANEILDELTSAMQRLETQSAGLLEFVKEKGIAKDGDLAPYLERAGAASAVRWRATRVRMARLFASAEKKAEQAADREKAALPQKEQPQEKTAPDNQRSQDDRVKKQAQSLATESAEGKTENESSRRAEEQGERPPAKGSDREARTEDKNVKPAQPQSSDKQSGKLKTDQGADSTRQSPGDAAQSEKGRDRDAGGPQKNDRNAA
jgi:hypothetical protein